MVCIRPARVGDLLEMQQCNLFNLPENYNMRYWLYHLMTWTYLPQVAIDEASGRIVGYVLSKMEDDTDKFEKIAHGHITSISVLRDYRKLGIATKLMRATHAQMTSVYNAAYCSLHVRISNRAARGMYEDVLNYEVVDVENEYYADKEDALDMVLFFDKAVREQVIKEKMAQHEKRRREKNIPSTHQKESKVDVSERSTFAHGAE